MEKESQELVPVRDDASNEHQHTVYGENKK